MSKEYIEIKIKKYYIKFFLDLFFTIFFINFGLFLYKYYIPSDGFSAFMVGSISTLSVIFGSHFCFKKLI